MSWVQNEDNWGQQFRAYTDDELWIPLPLRVEAMNPRIVYFNWENIVFRLECKQQTLTLRGEVFQ